MPHANTTTEGMQQDHASTVRRRAEAGPLPPHLGGSELAEPGLGDALVLDDEALRILASTGC